MHQIKIEEDWENENKRSLNISNQMSPRAPNQYNSMCFNSLTINGFIKDQNSVENEKLSASINQITGIDDEKVLFRKKESIDERRESVLLDIKVIKLIKEPL